MANEKLVDAIFDQFKDKQFYIDALQRAAEEVYQGEMVDTNMHVLEIGEEAEKYEYYTDKDSRQKAIVQCTWATKKEWIEDKINEWLL